MRTRKPYPSTRPKCPSCLHRGFWLKPYPFGVKNRPWYQCDKCGRQWSAGDDGGEWAGHHMGTISGTWSQETGQFNETGREARK